MIKRAGAQIDCHHRRNLRGAAPIYKLVRAKLVALDGLPSQLALTRSLCARPHPIQPVVATDEVAARITHDGIALLTHRRQHIAPEAALIRMGRLWLIQTAINAAPHVLGKTTKQQRRDFTDDAVVVNQ